MKKALRYIAYTLIGMITAFLLLIALVFINKKAIERAAINELNERLTKPVYIDGGWNLTLFSSFPRVSLHAQEVRIDSLLQVDDVFINLNLYQLVKKNIVIEGIALHDGWLHLQETEAGNNYTLLKSDSTSGKASKSLQISRIHGMNMAFSYQAEHRGIYVEQYIEDLTASGHFYQKQFNLKLDGQWTSKTIKSEGKSYLEGIAFAANTSLTSNAEGCLTFSDASIQLNSNEVRINGSLCPGQKTLAFTAYSEGRRLEGFLPLLPASIREGLPAFTHKGGYSLETTVEGSLNKPDITAHFQADNLRFTPGETIRGSLHATYLSGYYASAQDELHLDSLYITGNESKIHGHFTLEKLTESPSVIGHLSGTLGLADILPYLGDSSSIQNLSGAIEMENTDLLFSLTADSIITPQSLDGYFTFNQVNIETDTDTFGLAGTATFTPDRIRADNLAFQINQNRAKLTGYADGFSLSNPSLTDDLRVNVSIHANAWNLPLPEKETNGQQTPAIALPQGNYLVTADTFIMGPMPVYNVMVKWQSQADRVRLQQARAKGLGGSFTATGFLKRKANAFTHVSLNTELHQVDLEALFATWDDFDQDQLTHEHISGKVDANLQLSFPLAHTIDSLIVTGDATLSDGRLANPPALQSLSKWLSEDQLANISFSDIETSIAINDRVLYLYETVIQSNIARFELDGKHTFDNDVEYHLVLNVRNLLAAKFRKRKTLEEGYQNTTEGGMNLYLLLHGPTDNIEVETDKARKKEAKQERREERKPFFAPDETEPEKEIDRTEIEYLDW